MMQRPSDRGLRKDRWTRSTIDVLAGIRRFCATRRGERIEWRGFRSREISSYL